MALSVDVQALGLKFDPAGLIPAIVQDHASGAVLMFAFMNAESLERTIATGRTHFYSRSRGKLWLKGESSGHVQHVRSLSTDCDKDVLLIGVDQVGAACHDGYRSCFYRRLDGGVGGGEGTACTTTPTWTVVGGKVFDPAKVYGKS